MSDRGFDMRRNGAGILLFAVGVFFAVLFVQAFTSEVPVSEAGGTAALAALWIDSIGLLAGFVFCAGIAILGARMFLVDALSGSPVRSAGGLAGIAVGLSILAGSISAGAGGALGRVIGGGISGATHVAIGALVGIAVIAFSIWAVWLQGMRVARAGAEPEIEDDGVTAAEAAALIPTETNRTLADTRKTERVSTWTAPPSPYPEDVRRRGEIPAGAKPLEPTHDRTTTQSGQSGAPSSSVYRWTAARTDEPADGAGEDLARAIATASHVEPVAEDELDGDLAEPFAQALIADERVDEEPVDEERVHEMRAFAEPEPEVDAEDALEEEDLEDELLEVKALDAPALDAALLEEEPHDRIPEFTAALAERQPEIPRPTWEQSSLFAETEEPPVDAYGTPLALVDELAERARETEPAAEVAEVDDELDEDEDSDEDDSDEDDEEEADEDEEEYDEDDSEEESDEEDAEEDVEDEVYAEDEEEDGEEESEEEDPETEEISREPALAEAAADDRLKDVVLTPQAAASPRTPSAPELPADRQKLLVEVGCLFVDRGRVAVSMLQRQYSMDFDDACKVLDELQEMGLIGPYLGGQRRDILLTRDQWLEKVGSS